MSSNSRNDDQKANQPAGKAAKPKTAISPTREENYAEWYQQVIRAADLAENSPVRGCMVIKPWGYTLWENMQRALDDMFKATGHQNAYFPLFIPLSFMQKEAAHVEGFAKECAVVTHHRLEAGPDGKLRPGGRARRAADRAPDLRDDHRRRVRALGAELPRPAAAHQSVGNIVRWEMRTRMFLRTTEFLWQEGHTAHATAEEAVEETMRMLDVYATFVEEWLAVPVIKGEKTAGERFPGAVQTFCIEAMMQDRKALQAGTSHFLGQNFAKASEIKFLDQNGAQQYAWTTSWGSSTRLIGAMLMTHSDDDGFVAAAEGRARASRGHADLARRTRTSRACSSTATTWRASCARSATRTGRSLSSSTSVTSAAATRCGTGSRRACRCAWRSVRATWRRMRCSSAVAIARRRTSRAFRAPSSSRRSPRRCSRSRMRCSPRARDFREQHTRRIDTKEEFYAWFTPPRVPENAPTPIHGGFALTHFSGDVKLEERIKNELGVTVRCIPLEKSEPGTCPFTGQPSPQRVVWAKAY